jgi:hypothetical protein
MQAVVAKLQIGNGARSLVAALERQERTGAQVAAASSQIPRDEFRALLKIPATGSARARTLFAH